MVNTTKAIPHSTVLFDYYMAKCHVGTILFDQVQWHALEVLQSVYDGLLSAYQSSRSLLSLLRLRKAPAIKGVYLFGSVGVGKTLLMDCFYDCLPFPEKKRLHFHAFMQGVHEALKQHQEIKNPLALIAKKMAKKYRVLCLDEFIVTDIVDAMLLARLLEALFAEGICLITTSNTAPDDLYRDGLQRALFLPAIQYIKQHAFVIQITNTADYRAAIAEKSGIVLDLQHVHMHEEMERVFVESAALQPIKRLPICINNRFIPIEKAAGDVIWFDFNSICKPPRHQHDYLEIVKQYKTILVSDLPKPLPSDKNTLALFIRFIDVLYDAKITFMFSTHVPLEQLFDCAGYPDGYARACSRLKEMQAPHFFIE